MRWKRVELSKSPTLARERTVGAGAWEERVDSTVKKGRFQGGEGGQAMRIFIGEVGESMNRRVRGHKSSPEGSAKTWFYFKSAQT